MAPPSEHEMKEFSEHLAKNDVILHGNYGKELSDRFPLEDDQICFLDWYDRRGKEALQAEHKRLEGLCPTPEELIDRIAALEFWNEDARLDLCEILTNEVKVPCVILGRSGNFAYRLSPETEFLDASKRRESGTAEEDMPFSVLGVNLNVEAVRPSEHTGRSRRKMNLTDQSEVSNSSAEMDTAGDGFIFHQLGELEYSVGLQLSQETTQEDLAKAEWKPSGFGVVVEIEKKNGRAGAVYIVYNFFPEDALLGDRYHFRREHAWGRLPPNDDQQMGLAKIADSVRELNLQHTIEFVDVRDYEIELVTVLRTHVGTFLRATVAPRKDDDAMKEITAGVGSLA